MLTSFLLDHAPGFRTHVFVWLARARLTAIGAEQDAQRAHLESGHDRRRTLANSSLVSTGP